MDTLRVFTFRADWGLPTTGPFALKLLAWLNLAGIAYQQVFEDNSARGPKGKSPWIEHAGERIGDSSAIIERLAREATFDIDAGLADAERAQAHVWQRAFEEGFHQVLEWELFVHPAGAAYIDAAVAGALPPVVSGLVAGRLRARFRKQLHARGIARRSPDEIERIGRADLDALAQRLSSRTHLVADRPCLADLAVFGQVAPLVRWPMDTPVARHAKTLEPIVAFVESLASHCFGTLRAAA